MITKIELIEEDYLTTYHIKYDKKKLGILKNKLKKLGLQNIIEVYCQTENLDTRIQEYGYDDHFVIPKIEEVMESEEEYTLDIPYGFRQSTPKEVKVISYPILYHILFGKYKKNNGNFPEALKTYLSEDYGLKDENNKVLLEHQKKQQYCDREPLWVEYDAHLTRQQKQQMIADFFDSIEFYPITKESLTFINEQIELMSNCMDNPDKNRIEKISTRIKIARENKKNLETILQFLSVKEVKSKKEPKRRVKIPC